MKTNTTTRRSLSNVIATGALILIAATGFAQQKNTKGSEAIRPYHISVSEEAITDLRNRVNATRWPAQETVTDQSQGVKLAQIQGLVKYWGTDYD
ncbi:epoxide hydrolase N-terminal domain-containing protein [Flavobacterium sp. CLA17]|nr:epoxide hydrolase N-terminal domain-containing protein [Flavobacterium sp. CLA17]